jgi:hypothetical protein
MKKTLMGLAIVVVAMAGLSLAFSDNASDRPPGVAADRWTPISATLGVVLVPDSGLTAESPPPAGGPSPPDGGPLAGPKGVVGADPTALIAPPSPAVRKIIEEGQPVRGYIMVKRGKLWRPLLVVAPTVNN